MKPVTIKALLGGRDLVLDFPNNHRSRHVLPSYNALLVWERVPNRLCDRLPETEMVFTMALRLNHILPIPLVFEALS